jgi:hypothetical protein
MDANCGKNGPKWCKDGKEEGIRARRELGFDLRKRK